MDVCVYYLSLSLYIYIYINTQPNTCRRSQGNLGRCVGMRRGPCPPKIAFRGPLRISFCRVFVDACHATTMRDACGEGNNIHKCGQSVIYIGHEVAILDAVSDHGMHVRDTLNACGSM